MDTQDQQSGERNQHRTMNHQRLGRRAFVGLAGAAASAAILAACGGSGSGATSTPQTTTGAAAPAGSMTPAAAGSAPAAGGTSAAGAAAPHKGGTLVVAFTSDPEVLDPQITTSILAGYVISVLYDTLITRDYDGSFKPSLAEKWEISPDGKTYTFTMKKGVTFHSGKAFTSADVKDTFDRWRSIPNAPNAYTIQPIDTIETPDPLTVRFQLKTPYNIFLDQLAGVWAVILNKDAVDKAGKDYGVSAVDGTGPYKFVSWTRGQKLVTARHDAYTWGSPIFQNPGPAYVDGVEFRIYPEDTTRIAEFKAGNVHIVAEVPDAQVPQLNKTSGVSVVQYHQLETVYLGMNMKKPPVDDLKVRQAITYALNKNDIVAGGLSGLGTPAVTMMDPATPYYAKGIEQSAPTFDQQKAMALLDEAGWKAGSGGVREKSGQQLVVPFWCFNVSPWPLIGQIVEQQLTKVGIKVDLKTYEGSALLAALRAGDHTTYMLDFSYENADSVFYFYFYSKQQPAPNRYYYNVPEVDKLLDDTRTNPDKVVVAQDYDTIQRRILADAPSAPLVHRLGTVGKGNAVQGLKVHPSRWLYRMLDLSLTK